MSKLDRNWIKRYAQKDKDGNPMGLFSCVTPEGEWETVEVVSAHVVEHSLIQRGADSFEMKVKQLVDAIRANNPQPDELVLKARLVRSETIGDLHMHITYDDKEFGIVELLVSQSGMMMAPHRHCLKNLRN